MQTLVFFSSVDDTFRMEESNYAVIRLYRLCGDYGLDHGQRGGDCSIFGCNMLSGPFWRTTGIRHG